MFTENLALHQPTWQSSTYRSDTGAGRAVDGYTGLCAVSVYRQTTAEWRVDLGGVKYIHHVVIQHVKSLGKSILEIIYFEIINCYINESMLH